MRSGGFVWQNQLTASKTKSSKRPKNETPIRTFPDYPTLAKRPRQESGKTGICSAVNNLRTKLAGIFYAGTSTQLYCLHRIPQFWTISDKDPYYFHSDPDPTLTFRSLNKVVILAYRGTTYKGLYGTIVILCPLTNSCRTTLAGQPGQLRHDSQRDQDRKAASGQPDEDILYMYNRMVKT